MVSKHCYIVFFHGIMSSFKKNIIMDTKKLSLFEIFPVELLLEEELEKITGGMDWYGRAESTNVECSYGPWLEFLC